MTAPPQPYDDRDAAFAAHGRHVNAGRTAMYRQLGIGPGFSLAEDARLFAGVERDDGPTPFEAILSIDAPLVLFTDGVESGDTEAWSTTAP